MFLNKNDMIDLLNHLITTGRFWHLEYARQNVIEDEFQKIKKERDKFDDDILKKGLDIINSVEPKSNIKRIKVFVGEQYSIFANNEYTSYQLEQILESLKKSEDINIEGSVKILSIDKESIHGYEVSYETEYDGIFRKGQQEENKHDN